MFIAILLLAVCTVSAKTKTVEGSTIFYIPSNMTRNQAEEEAIRRAKIDALNKAFGNSITASNTSIVSNDDERFFSNGFDIVKGEWIETIGTPEIKTGLDGTGDVFLSVKIRGKAREKETADIDICAKILRNGVTANCESSEFKNSDKMYMSFVSPVDGYLCVYQHDPVSNDVYCLLPYRKDGTGSVKIVHDREYVFFSKANSDNPRIVDEYRLGCSPGGDVNTIYIIFSTNEFSKSSTVGNDKYTPRSIPFEDFDSWKSKCQAQDAGMQVITKNLVIRD